jgi:hypothetical protein
MFRKLFGGKKNRRKKRLSPSAATPEGLMQSHPMYHYAMKEYAQTVPANTYNEDGRIHPTFSMNDEEAVIVEEDDEDNNSSDMVDDSAPHKMDPNRDVASAAAAADGTSFPVTSSKKPSVPIPILRVSSYKSDATGGGSVRSGGGRSLKYQHASEHHYHQQHLYFSPKTEYVLSEDDASQAPRHQGGDFHSAGQSTAGPSLYLEPPMPDTTYEEWYGDAYVGGPIKYIYPSGYQSMRPRSGPWKLSIVVCLLFTWLSVFVIGHCSDKADVTGYDGYYYNAQGNNNENSNYYEAAMLDDKLVIETKWCGSRLLYWMWVISMLITGLATAYCSVIGYIKVRDFAVANSRSQPPGVAVSKSDYYVQITDAGLQHHQQHQYGPTTTATPTPHPSQYHKTIYQADGTPQFWGNQIYRPTQAAVAITSR